MRPQLRACNEGLPRLRVARARRALGSAAYLHFDSHLLRFCDGFFDGPDHVKRLLRQMVVLAFKDLLKASNGILELHVLTGCAGKRFGHVEGL